jgi:hypothetical protein
VWVAEKVPGLNHQQETYHRTRQSAIAQIESILLNHAQHGRRVLVGFDFSFGYPNGFATALGLPTGPSAWLQVWTKLEQVVEDTSENLNNRFLAAAELNRLAGAGSPGPFWGCPVGKESANLRARSPGFPFHAAAGVTLARLRLTEARLKGVQDSWGLFGAGRVGGQTLVGIPYLARLRRHPELGQFSRVWPFETSFANLTRSTPAPRIVYAEIWPGCIEEQVRGTMQAKPTFIRDRAQVRALCDWAAGLDDQRELAPLFDRPAGLTPGQLQSCTEEEGWILGAR